MGDVKVIQDPINGLLSRMEQQSCKIDNLFIQMMDMSNDLSNMSVSFKDKMKLVMSTEFIMYKLRLIASAEQNQIKYILTKQSEYPASTIVAFKKRDAYLASVIQKLTDIRADMEVIQKTAYGITYQNSKL